MQPPPAPATGANHAECTVADSAWARQGVLVSDSEREQTTAKIHVCTATLQACETSLIGWGMLLLSPAGKALGIPRQCLHHVTLGEPLSSLLRLLETARARTA